MKAAMILPVAVVLTGQLALASGGPYALESSLDFADRIVRFDPSYQSATPLADLPADVVAIDFSRDGWLYGIDPWHSLLVRFDPATGAREAVGPLGVDLGTGERSLDEDTDGQLWMLADEPDGNLALYRIDRGTGAASRTCQLDDRHVSGLALLDGHRFTLAYGPGPHDPGCGFEVLPLDHEPWSLEVGPDGWIHLINCVPIGQWWSICWFTRFDLATGREEELGRIEMSSRFYYSLTFNPAEQPTGAAIPVLDRRGILMFVLLLTVAGVGILARRA